VTTPDGPYLYEEGPEKSPFTGTPRNRNRLLLLVLLATVVVAVAAVVALPLITGTAEKQSTQVVTVFVKALQAGDTETAYGLLCSDERTRLQPDGVAAAYLLPGTAHVGKVSDAEHGADPARRVEVRWTDGGAVTRTFLTVVNQDGAHVCGTTSAG
jgi:hypothetical protein